MPLGNMWSRRREVMADEYALESTHMPDAFVTAMTRLANQNLADAEPPAWVEFLLHSHPSIRMLTEPVKQVKKRAQLLKRRLKNILADHGSLEIRQDVSEVGSGSLAGYSLATWVVAIKPARLSAENLARDLRLSDPPIFCRVKEDQVMLDCSTIRKDELPMIQKAFKNILMI